MLGWDARRLERARRLVAGRVPFSGSCGQSLRRFLGGGGGGGGGLTSLAIGSAGSHLPALIRARRWLGDGFATLTMIRSDLCKVV